MRRLRAALRRAECKEHDTWACQKAHIHTHTWYWLLAAEVRSIAASTALCAAAKSPSLWRLAVGWAGDWLVGSLVDCEASAEPGC